MSSHVWGAQETQYFHTLTPDHVLNAVEDFGYQVTGRVMQLNSMENRVYEVEMELDHEPETVSDAFKIIKFYRPGRWTKEQIQEEHDFIWDLKDMEIPAIAPLKNKEGKTLFTNSKGFTSHFSLKKAAGNATSGPIPFSSKWEDFSRDFIMLAPREKPTTA